MVLSYENIFAALVFIVNHLLGEALYVGEYVAKMICLFLICSIRQHRQTGFPIYSSYSVGERSL